MQPDIERTRESLRFVRFGFPSDHVVLTARVSDADLASLGWVKAPDRTNSLFADKAKVWAEANGYVKRPACDDCEGIGKVPVNIDRVEPCPSCGGSGFGKLMALDGIDVEALETFERQWRNDPPSGMTKRVLQAVRQVLAAIDQEDTDV